jgi:hypothetical protein
MVLVAGALAWLTGCDLGCWCPDGITVTLPPNTLVQGKPYAFDFCADGACTHALISPVKQGVICTGDPWLCDATVGTSSTITVLFTDRHFLASAPTRQIMVVVTGGGQIVAQKSGSVSTEMQRGAGCDSGGCRRGTLN